MTDTAGEFLAMVARNREREAATLKAPVVKRCKHELASLTHYDGKTVIAECKCGLAWYGAAYQWWSRRGRKKQPPLWVRRLIEDAKGSPNP